MSAVSSLSARVAAWCDRQNALDDDVQRARPAFWHIGKIVVGVLFLAKGAAHALVASGPGRSALAALFVVGGAMFVHEGVKALRARRLARRTAG